MALETAKTLTSGTATSAIKNRYYDELFLRVAENKLVHKQLGQMNRNIAKGEGGYGANTVYWTRWTNLDLITSGTGEGVPTTAVQLTASNVTGSTAQYDNAVSISDLMAYTAMGDVMKAAVSRLAYNAGLSIDTIIRNVVVTSGTGLATGGVTAAAWTSIPSTATLSIADVRRANRTLSRNNANQVDGSWIAVAHPDTLYDIYADTSTGGWIDSNKYTAGNADKLFTAEVGKLLGTRFLETANAATRGTGITTSATVYCTGFFGSDAFGVTELQGLRTYIKAFGSGGTGDPTDKISTAGWKCTFGAAILNTAFYVSMMHAVTSTA